MKLNLKLFVAIICASVTLQGCDNDDNSGAQQQETVVDIDGNVYGTVTIGNQIWMTSNLKTTTYNDGTPITQWQLGDSWYSVSNQNAYYDWADTSDLSNMFEEELPQDYYGAQYNHFAIESGKLAPQGWRIPTEQDFKDLETYLANNGHEGNEANALKSTSGWSANSGNGTDAVGFNALPTGYASTLGTATGSPVIAILATSDITQTTSTSRKIITLFDEPGISFFNESAAIGTGIRCIKN